MGSVDLLGQLSCKSRQPTRPCNPTMLAVAVVALLCSTVTLGASQVVYQMQCPEPCVCRLGENTTLSINCSSRVLRLNSAIPLLVQASMAQNASSEDNDTQSGTTSNVASLEPRLKLLDLSLNALTSVSAEDVFEIDLPLTLTALLSVVTLNASHNSIQILSEFGTYTGLVHLDVSSNNIHNVSDMAFAGLESLEWLDLSHNMISVLGNSVFSTQVNLHSLDLSHNKLKVLHNLHALSSLRYLYLQHNRLQALSAATQPSLLPSIPSLKYLDLSDNPLMQTYAGMFHTLPALKALNLTRCSITHLDNNFLEGAASLHELRLDENNVTAIASPVFQNTSLSSLSLSSMSSFTNLSHRAFLGLSGLHHLNLSHNPELSFVHPHLLSHLPQLEQLDLSHCSIPILSQITFHYNQLLQAVYLNSNPLACSCVNAWLAEELPRAVANKSHFKDLDTVACVNASSHQQQPLVTQSFQCDEINLHNISSTASVHLGGQLLLRCDHSSAAPPSLVSWTTPRGKVYLLHDFHPQANSHLLSQQDIQPGADYHKGHYWRSSTTYHPHLSDREDRVMILSDGSLYIDYMLRTDTGPYLCLVSNSHYNQSATVLVYLDYKISGEIQIYAIIVGLLCALAFFTLNLIYVIISWIARRLVNKRRREIIRQMLENMNAYKSTQITRIHENYTHQLGRVRNQYHMQRDRLHRNYSLQVTRMKRGCSNQVEKVRDNYTTRLAQLRDYSSNQIVLIRERANNQIVRIRDYGTLQLEKLRETYKLQHLHVMKLLDTMNLDNCRHIVETECMRAESMMFDVDLLGDDLRTDSPMSGVDSEYTTPDTSPAPSLEVNAPQGLAEDMAQHNKPQRQKILHPAKDSPPIVLEMQSTLTSAEGGLALDVTDQWEYTDHSEQDKGSSHTYLMNLYIPGKDKNETILQLQSEPDLMEEDYDGSSYQFKESYPLPLLFLEEEEEPNISDVHKVKAKEQAEGGSSPFMTPEASPSKKLKPLQGLEADASGETDL